ncbi:MAG: NAD+ synthase [Methanoregula sp.]
MGQVEQMIRYAYWNTGSKGIVIGLSGGIDSAVAAAFCCQAVGPANVLGLSLPTEVSDPADTRDVGELCSTLGMTYKVIDIEPMLAAYRGMPEFRESPYLLGNLMARIRMTVLYYHANRDSRLVCGTSNRSEYMLGYCTKYGDNAADIQPILHLYKTDIYVVARELGIPAPILEKTPSAGLWKGQSDEAEIGLSYAEIDASLRALESHNWRAESPVERKVFALVQKSGHKRISAPNLLAVPQKPAGTSPGN